MKNQTGKTMKCLRIENDLKFCKNEGMARQRTICYTPQQNGVAKRMNKTLLERVGCMLSNSRLNRSFRAKAINTTCYLLNRSASTAIDFRTVIKVWSNKPAKYLMLKVFGCSTYHHVSEGKLEPKAKKGVFICYRDEVKGFRI